MDQLDLELVWQGRLHLGDGPGVYGDASYVGLGVELPLTLRRFPDADGPPAVSMLVETEGLQPRGGLLGPTVLHWDNAIDGADGQGVLFSGDVLSVVADRRWVTFMYSYPNDIPLDSTTVRRMADMLEPYAFDRIHDAFDRHVTGDARHAVARSAERYIRHVDGRAGPTI